ncbi:MAG: hypothetical protein ACRDGI_08880 [Candidatus Limnocylindrales bacterium]
MTGRLTTLGEARRELEAADDKVQPGAGRASEAAAPAAVKARQNRVQRKLALIRSIWSDGTSTLRAAIRLQSATKAAN